MLGVLIGEYVVYRIMNKEDESTRLTKTLSIIILTILTLYFVLFTFVTPRINYFRDPVNGEYGRSIIK